MMIKESQSKVASPQLSVSTWNYAGAYGEKANLEEIIQEVLADGFGMELWLGWPADREAPEEEKALGRKNWDRLAQLLENSPAISLHTQHGEWDFEGLKEEIELGSHLKGNREDHSILVVHQGTIDIVDAESRLDNAKRVVEYADSREVLIALENTGRDATAVLEHATEVEGLGICIDICHANLEKQRGAAVLRYFEDFRDKLIHLHVSDSDPERGGHLTPGEGDMPWEAVLQKLSEIEFRGFGALEIRMRPPRELSLRSRERLLG